jgi:hypothetical protein
MTLWPFEDEIGAISLRDIANHLSKIVYFPESAHAPFTAAQYAIELATSLKHAAPHIRLHGLLKNAYEAYLGHVPATVRAAEKSITDHPWSEDNRDVLVSAVTVRILKALGLLSLYNAYENGPSAIEAPATIKLAQNRLNSTLERDLGAFVHRHNDAGRAEPFSRVIAPLHWDHAFEKYIRTYESLSSQAEHSRRP